LPIGTILLTSRATIGAVSILKNEGCTNQGFQSLIAKEDINNDFLYYKLLTIKNIILSLASGSTFLEISPNKLRQIEISIPTFAEQTAIAAIFSDMDAEIEALQTKLQKAKLVKQGAMQELLTGKIRLINNIESTATQQPQIIELKPQKTGHNDQINEAIVISFLVHKFGTAQYPLSRFRYTKYAYLLHRQAEHVAKGFLKHAGGPYKSENRYKGGEKIALKNEYISKVENPKSGKDAFIINEQIEKALSYFREWYGTDIQQWIEQFRYYKNDDLEVLTTVDESICDLQGQNKIITVGSIKEYIRSIPKWKEKLNKPCFSDSNIQQAINKSYQLFG
jgi:type I restriction enzyme S subunit